MNFLDLATGIYSVRKFTDKPLIKRLSARCVRHSKSPKILSRLHFLLWVILHPMQHPTKDTRFTDRWKKRYSLTSLRDKMLLKTVSFIALTILIFIPSVVPTKSPASLSNITSSAEKTLRSLCVIKQNFYILQIEIHRTNQ